MPKECFTGFTPQAEFPQKYRYAFCQRFKKPYNYLAGRFFFAYLWPSFPATRVAVFLLG